jgi:hypothetical protein
MKFFIPCRHNDSDRVQTIAGSRMQARQSSNKDQDLHDIHRTENENYGPNKGRKIRHNDTFSFVDLILNINSAPIRLGKKMSTKNMQIDALNADAADTPAREKKKMAVVSRTPRSLNDIGRMTDFVNRIFAVHKAETPNDTGSNASTKK